VDNASEDKTIEAVAKRFLGVQVIANDDNRGFSAANNQGIVSSKGKRIAFLNPDTLLTENSFKKIFAYMESHPEYSILDLGLLMRTIYLVLFDFGRIRRRMQYLKSLIFIILQMSLKKWER
jgi:GT2 family glycosyltransferase